MISYVFNYKIIEKNRGKMSVITEYFNVITLNFLCNDK